MVATAAGFEFAPKIFQFTLSCNLTPAYDFIGAMEIEQANAVQLWADHGVWRIAGKA